MDSSEKIVRCLDRQLNQYKQPVTELSKTDENDFIISNAIMFDWDEISKLYDGDDSSSVDAIYCFIEDNTLTLYFFEFKNFNLHDPFFDAKKQLEYLINDLDACVFNCCYPEEMRKLKKKLISKKVISLKTKPMESLILLHNVLNEAGISSEEIISVKKEYYVVSTTPSSGNKANWHRRGRNREIFGFIDKIKPFPFINVDHLNKETFSSLIDELQTKNQINT